MRLKLMLFIWVLRIPSAVFQDASLQHQPSHQQQQQQQEEQPSHQQQQQQQQEEQPSLQQQHRHLEQQQQQQQDVQAVKVFSLQRGLWSVATNTTYIRYNFSGEVPRHATLLTLCYRIRFEKFLDLNTHFSYSVSQENFDILGSYNGEHHLMTWFQGKSQAPDIGTDTWVVSPGLWTHLCHVFGESTYLIYWDGQEFYSSDLSPGWSLPLNGSLVLGQEQDELGGGFDHMQGFMGEMAQVSIWDRALSRSEIISLASCEGTGRGNLFSSDTSALELSGAVEVTPMDVDQLCGSVHGYYFVMLPEMRNFAASVSLCGILNATAAIPTSSLDTELLTQELEPFHDVCSPSTLWKVWLGISDELEEDVWRDISSQEPIDYLNFGPNYPAGGSLYNCALLMTNGQWIDSSCRTTRRQCVICHMERTDFLRLRGLCFDSEHQMRFSLRGMYTDGRPLFSGYYDKVIQWSATSKQWTLTDTANNSTMLRTSGIMTRSYPLGKHSWIVEGEVCELPEGTSVTLSLSPCDNEHFMCNSGHCITKDDRCNLRYDCTDGSDELNCAKIIVGDEYQIQLPPVGSQASVLMMHARLTLTRVANVDEINMAITLEFEMVLTWVDNRVSLRHLTSSKTGTILGTADRQKVWTPTYQFVNLQSGQAKLLSENMVVVTANNATPPSFNDPDMDTMYPGASNNLSLVHQYTASIICLFNFRSYPVDVQLCRIIVSLPSTYEGHVHFSTLDSTMVYTGAQDLAQYSVKNPRVAPRSGKSRMMFEFELHRRPGVIVMSTFMPSMLLLLVSWATLFVKLEALNVRAIMSLTTLLVLYTLFSNLSSSLPKSAEIKLIDVWFFSIIFVLFINIMVHIFVTDKTEPRPISERKRLIFVSPAGPKTTKPVHLHLEPILSLRFLTVYRSIALPIIIVVLNIVFWVTVHL